MKKHIVVFCILIISASVCLGEVKPKNLSDSLPSKIKAVNYYEGKKTENITNAEENEALAIVKGAAAVYSVNVMKNGIYNVGLRLTAKKGTIVTLYGVSEADKSKIIIDKDINETDLVETSLYLDGRTKFVTIAAEKGNAVVDNIIFSYLIDGGAKGLEGQYALNRVDAKYIGENELKVVKTGEGVYKISMSNGDSDVIEEGKGGQISKSGWINEDNQVWKIIKGNSGKLIIVNKKSGKAITKANNGVIASELNYGDEQQWEVIKKAETAVISKNKNWVMVWNDEFNYNGVPDKSKWSFEVQGAGWVNEELQNYTDRPENCRVENGKLIIEARRDNYKGAEYSSARIKTLDKGDWLYGRMAIRAKLPKGVGVWPAIWMMPTDYYAYGGGWPGSGEIDIMENVGYEGDMVHASLHSHKYNFRDGTQRTSSLYVNNISNSFHDYILEWDEDGITISVDDMVVGKWNDDKTGWESWPWNKRFYLILNLAVGGNWGGQQGVDTSIWPQKMEVDYVRIYQK